MKLFYKGFTTGIFMLILLLAGTNTVSAQTQMKCGGNIVNPPVCPTGYTCKLGSIPDAGGFCVPTARDSLTCDDCAQAGQDGICFNIQDNRSYCVSSTDKPDVGLGTICGKCSSVPITPVPSTTISGTPTCIPRPPCLDAIPKCPYVEPNQGWCPITTPFPSTPPPGCFYKPNGVCTIACPVNNPYCCPPILICPSITPPLTPPPGCFYKPNFKCTIACPANNPYCCPPILICPSGTPAPSSCSAAGGTCQPSGSCSTTQTNYGALDCSTNGSQTCCVPLQNQQQNATFFNSLWNWLSHIF